MEIQNIKTKVKHSESKYAWNVVGTTPGGKYKIARIPYTQVEDHEIFNTKEKAEALEHALFICRCFNNSEKIKP